MYWGHRLVAPFIVSSIFLLITSSLTGDLIFSNSSRYYDWKATISVDICSLVRTAALQVNILSWTSRDGFEEKAQNHLDSGAC